MRKVFGLLAVWIGVATIGACGGSGNGTPASGGSGTGGATGGSTGSGGTAPGGSSGNTGGAATGGAPTGGAPTGGAPTGGSTGGAVGGSSGVAGASVAGRAGGGTVGSAGNVGIAGRGQGGRSGTGGGGGSVPLPGGVLRISSDMASFEYTPARYAAENYYPGQATVVSGGITGLFNAGSSAADLGTNAETQALRQYADHPNLRIIFTVTETFYRIIGSKKAGITNVASLAGKRVGTLANTSAAYYLDKMLRTANLTDTSVTVVSINPLSRMAAMLQGGMVDAVTAWEPEPQNAADAIGSDAVEIQDRSVYREIVNLHSTAEKLADPVKRAQIVAFVKALIKTEEKFRTDEVGVRSFVAQAAGFTPELTAKIWHNEQFLGTLVPDLLDVLEVEEVWVAAKSNRTARKRADLAPLVDDSILKEALATP